KVSLGSRGWGTWTSRPCRAGRKIITAWADARVSARRTRSVPGPPAARTLRAAPPVAARSTLEKSRVTVALTLPGAPPAVDSPAMPALLGGRFQIEALLGQGGMGRVFRARDLLLDEHVALKVLHPEFVERPGALERIRREVKLARRVTHRSV